MSSLAISDFFGLLLLLLLEYIKILVEIHEETLGVFCVAALGVVVRFQWLILIQS